MKTTLFIRDRFPKAGRILFALGVSLSLLNTAQAQMNGTYTIDKNGSASSTNFLSFTAASEALQGNTRSDGGPSLGGGINGNVVINVTAGSGPYTEQVVIPEISGSASYTLTINGNSNMLEFSGDYSNPSVLKLEGADRTSIKNLKLKPTNADYAVGVWLCNGANFNTIEGCDINVTASTTPNYWSSGISLVNDALYPGNYSYNSTVGSNNSFVGNTIYGSVNNSGMMAGIILYGSYEGSDANNLVRGNSIANSYQYGVYQNYMKRTAIDGNLIRNVNKYNANYFFGVQSHQSPHARIVNNEINYVQNYTNNNNYYYYNQAFGVYSYSSNHSGNFADTVEVINNTISGCVNGYFYGVLVENYLGKVDILHNTIVARTDANNNNNNYYYYYSGKYGIYTYSHNYYYNTGNQVSINIKNNIIDLKSDVNNSQYYYYGYVYNLLIYGNQNSVSCDGNVLSVDANSYNQYIGHYSNGNNGYTATTLSSWQSQTGLDQNSSDVRPSYVDTANYNFTPTTAALNNMGVAAGVAYDRLGATRSTTTPDPGAIEFTATGGSVVANAIDATIYVNSAGVATLNVSDIDSGSTATAGIASKSLSKTSYDCSNVGSNSVVLTVTANGGATAYDTATVTVIDNLLPTVVTKTASVTLSGGTASITATDVNDGSYDNCAVASVSVSPVSFDCSDLGANTVTLTVTDVNGNTNTGTATVTVNGAQPVCALTATPSNNTYTGAASNQMFIGYGPQSMDLSCAASGGSGFSYSWSGSYLSSTSGATNVFTPTAGGNYTITCTVTNSNGCETTCTITLCVLDIRSNTSTTAPKVYLCHSPNGNSSNVQTLSVSVNAVASHLSNHSGDKLGQCTQTCGSLKNDVTGELYEIGEGDLIVYPNPSSGVFKFTLESESDELITIHVYDANGKLVVSKTGGHAFEEIHIDASELTAGIYMAVVSQGELTKTVKLTKVN